jgi:hypothetical protein
VPLRHAKARASAGEMAWGEKEGTERRGRTRRNMCRGLFFWRKERDGNPPFKSLSSSSSVSFVLLVRSALPYCRSGIQCTCFVLLFLVSDGRDRLRRVSSSKKMGKGQSSVLGDLSSHLPLFFLCSQRDFSARVSLYVSRRYTVSAVG